MKHHSHPNHFAEPLSVSRTHARAVNPFALSRRDIAVFFAVFALLMATFVELSVIAAFVFPELADDPESLMHCGMLATCVILAPALAYAFHSERRLWDLGYFD